MLRRNLRMVWLFVLPLGLVLLMGQGTVFSARAGSNSLQNGNNNGQNGNGQNNDVDESIVKQGLAIAPVALNLRGKNRALVGLGSYLVNAVSECNDCHTRPHYVQGGN